MPETWFLKGHYVMACNCDFGCPCNFNARPSTGACEGVMGYVFDEGRWGDVSLDGTRAAGAVKWPGAIHEGNGHGVIFIDAGTTPPQREGLTEILFGRAGGPLGIIYGNTLSRIDGPHFVPIKATVSGKESELIVDGRIRMLFDSIKNPVSGAEAFPRVVLPQGLLTHELEQFTTREFEVNEGEVSMTYPGRTAQIARIDWQGP